MNHILVLCMGNICRSPVAEAILKHQFPEKNVWSAGLEALVGNPPDPFAIEVASTHGLDISRHHAQQLTPSMCQQAEMILVMEQSKKNEVEQKFPLARGKVYRLGDVENFDIADPYRKRKEQFEIMYKDIQRGIDTWIPRIRRIT